MAYGNHVIQIANSYIDNGFEVNIYYPETYNDKSIYQDPEQYYKSRDDIEFKKINNFDITSFTLYEILPNLFKKILYTAMTVVWCLKLSKCFENEEYVWSTNPNILLIVKKYFKFIIYEKHGAARFIQKFSISRLKKDKKSFLIGVTKKSVQELYGSINNPLYLPNGVDENLFFTLLNIIDQDNKFLIVTSVKSIVEIPFKLDDINSRSKNFLLSNIERPDDELMFALILKNLSDRQISIDKKLIDYIIKRIDRSYSKIFDFIYKIDEISLKRKKSIDFKIIKEVLGE